jgi:hypothetical protein
MASKTRKGSTSGSADPSVEDNKPLSVNQQSPSPTLLGASLQPAKPGSVTNEDLQMQMVLMMQEMKQSQSQMNAQFREQQLQIQTLSSDLAVTKSQLQVPGEKKLQDSQRDSATIPSQPAKSQADAQKAGLMTRGAAKALEQQRTQQALEEKASSGLLSPSETFDRNLVADLDFLSAPVPQQSRPGRLAPANAVTQNLSTSGQGLTSILGTAAARLGDNELASRFDTQEWHDNQVIQVPQRAFQPLQPQTDVKDSLDPFADSAARMLRFGGFAKYVEAVGWRSTPSQQEAQAWGEVLDHLKAGDVAKAYKLGVERLALISVGALVGWKAAESLKPQQMLPVSTTVLTAALTQSTHLHQLTQKAATLENSAFVPPRSISTATSAQLAQNLTSGNAVQQGQGVSVPASGKNWGRNHKAQGNSAAASKKQQQAQVSATPQPAEQSQSGTDRE